MCAIDDDSNELKKDDERMKTISHHLFLVHVSLPLELIDVRIFRVHDCNMKLVDSQVFYLKQVVADVDNFCVESVGDEILYHVTTRLHWTCVRKIGKRANVGIDDLTEHWHFSCDRNSGADVDFLIFHHRVPL